MLASPRITLRALHAVAAMNDRRRYRRVRTAIAGRMLDARGMESRCDTLDVSAGGALLRIEGGAAPNGPVVLYLDRIGRITAEPVRSEGFGEVSAMRFTVGAAKRERVAESLTEIINQPLLEAEERRCALRKAGMGPAIVTPEEGPSFPAELAEISMVGAIVRIGDVKPPRLGSWVRIGMTWGKVARLIEGGFAVDFEPRAARA